MTIDTCCKTMCITIQLGIYLYFKSNLHMWKSTCTVLLFLMRSTWLKITEVTTGKKNNNKIYILLWAMWLLCTDCMYIHVRQMLIKQSTSLDISWNRKVATAMEQPSAAELQNFAAGTCRHASRWKEIYCYQSRLTTGHMRNF